MPLPIPVCRDRTRAIRGSIQAPANDRHARVRRPRRRIRAASRVGVAIADATEIQVRAECKLEELLAKTETNKGANGSKVTGSVRAPVKDARPTLAEQGIDRKLSSRAQPCDGRCTGLNCPNLFITALRSFSVS